MQIAALSRNRGTPSIPNVLVAAGTIRAGPMSRRRPVVRAANAMELGIHRNTASKYALAENPLQPYPMPSIVNCGYTSRG